MVFGRQQPVPSPDEAYTLEAVQNMLDQIGLFRLQVSDPKHKVLLTLIAWNGENALIAMSGGTSPTKPQIISFQSLLQDELDVLQQYVEIQNKPDQFQPNTESLLRSGYEATKGLASNVLRTDQAGGRPNLSAFEANARRLSAQQYR